jgi:hypothetical protein
MAILVLYRLIRLKVMLPSVSSASDLVTSPEEICRGFLDQAQQKSRQATPVVQEANQMLVLLKQKDNLRAALHEPNLRKHLYTAAGLSRKSQQHLGASDFDAILEHVFHDSKFGDDWREEIVFRFLLVKGDSLGGSMRNITGAAASRRFADVLMQVLDRKGIECEVLPSREEKKIKSIYWGNRSLLLDRKSPLVDKNIDVILLDRRAPLETDALLRSKERYLACGELKGGIDPAGADEHWKTANSALRRIRDTFDHRPHLFFVGAAIASAMANEIFNQLVSGELRHAANFTKQQQLVDLAEWLVEL